MKVQLRYAALTFKGFSTVLCQIKASLNSKPICGKLADIEDIEVLTPDRFLPVDRLVAIKEPTTEDFPIVHQISGAFQTMPTKMPSSAITAS
jgi:hypothetical protein